VPLKWKNDGPVTDDEIWDILASVFALVEKLPDEPPKYLGTTVLVDNDGTFLSARHVLSGRQLDRVVAVSLEHDVHSGDRPIATVVEDVVLAEDVDLARGRAKVLNGRAIRVADRAPAAGGDVLSAEFSRSTRLDPEGGLGFEKPSILKGNIVRAFSTDAPPFQRRTQCYELSFAALLGASGAPVVDLDQYAIVGVIIANVATHLIPAQVERIEDDAGRTEETLYYLPHAYAIAYSEFGVVL